MKQGQKVVDGAQPYLEAGEEMLIGLVAQARGATTARAGEGAIARGVGDKWAGGNTNKAAGAGLVVESPMGLVLTDRRLMTLKISTPWGFGLGGSVKELLSAVPLEAVDSIGIKRLGVGRSIHLTVRGTEFKLECGAGADAQGLADAFEQTRSSALSA